MKKIDTLKYLSLLEEFETSEKLIKLGFGELQYINLNNDFYFLPFQLLSQGFERFMKAYICIGHFDLNNKLPDSKYLKKFGHDLEKLLKEILDTYYIMHGPVQFEMDRKFLTEDEDLKELLFILSEFGKLARYYNFDYITDNTKIGIDPKGHWEKFENKKFPINENMMKKLMNHDVKNEVFEEITHYIIVIFERFISSLSRQINFGTLGQTGKQIIVSSFFHFGTLYEEKLGKTDYRNNTLKFKESLKSKHKRNLFDCLKRKYNSNYKSKKIREEDFFGNWPFYVNEVIIESRKKHWYIITIEDYDYALNGAASGRFKLENPHNAGMAILGESLDEFIKMAREL